VGSLFNAAAVGILDSSDQPELAQAFIAYLLSESAQAYFASETYEYPLANDVPALAELRPLEQLDPPEVDLSSLDDLEGTLSLMRDAGLLP
jgi:iron(III) transport system substrate-binding protein